MRWNGMKFDKLAMISQPMGGMTDREINAEIKRVEKIVNDMGYGLIDSFFDDYQHSDIYLKNQGVKNIGVKLLGDSLSKMSKVDLVYFVKGWSHYRGCRIEHDAAIAYNIKIIEE